MRQVTLKTQTIPSACLLPMVPAKIVNLLSFHMAERMLPVECGTVTSFFLELDMQTINKPPPETSSPPLEIIQISDASTVSRLVVRMMTLNSQ